MSLDKFTYTTCEVRLASDDQAINLDDSALMARAAQAAFDVTGMRFDVHASGQDFMHMKSVSRGNGMRIEVEATDAEAEARLIATRIKRCHPQLADVRSMVIFSDAKATFSV